MNLLIALVAMGVIGLFGLVDYSYAQTNHIITLQEGHHLPTCNQIPNGCIIPNELVIKLGDSITVVNPTNTDGSRIGISGLYSNFGDISSNGNITIYPNKVGHSDIYIQPPEYGKSSHIVGNITIHGTEPITTTRIPFINNKTISIANNSIGITISMSEPKLNEVFSITTHIDRTKACQKTTPDIIAPNMGILMYKNVDYIHGSIHDDIHESWDNDDLTEIGGFSYYDQCHSDSLIMTNTHEYHLLDTEDLPKKFRINISYDLKPDQFTFKPYIQDIILEINTNNTNPAPPKPPKTIPNPFDELESKIENLQTRYNMLESQYNDILTKYNDLQSQPRINPTELNQTKSDLSNLQTKYNDLESQYNDLQSQYNTLQTKADKLKNKTDTKIERKDLWKERHSICFDKKENLKTELNQCNESKSTLETQLEQYKLDSVYNENQCTQLLDDHETQITTLQGNITEYQFTIEKLKQEKADLTKQVEELETNNQDLQQRLDELEN